LGLGTLAEIVEGYFGTGPGAGLRWGVAYGRPLGRLPAGPDARLVTHAAPACQVPPPPQSAVSWLAIARSLSCSIRSNAAQKNQRQKS
jgi:hypothetical protein